MGVPTFSIRLGGKQKILNFTIGLKLVEKAKHITQILLCGYTLYLASIFLAPVALLFLYL